MIDWTDIQPRIVEILSEKKESHLTQLKRKHLEKRWNNFITRFNEWVQAQAVDWSFRPHAIDISIMEPFSTVIFTSFTEEAEFKIDDIDRAVKEWTEWRDNYIFSLLPQDLQDRYQPNKPSLQPLAIFRFSHPFCKNYPLTSACSRRRSTADPVPPSLTFDERKICEAVVQAHLGNVLPWKWTVHDLRFETASYEFAVEVLKFLGMDPYTTTLTQVSDYKLMFKCLECKCPTSFTCWHMVSPLSSDRHGYSAPPSVRA